MTATICTLNKLLHEVKSPLTKFFILHSNVFIYRESDYSFSCKGKSKELKEKKYLYPQYERLEIPFYQTFDTLVIAFSGDIGTMKSCC